MRRHAALTLVLMGSLALAGCGDRVAIERAEAARAALAADDYERAEVLAQEAAERGAANGDPRFEAFRYFVRGNVAYARSLVWQAEAERGDPEAAKMAYQDAEDALAYWQMAAASRDDWPAARRNVERGLLHMQALRESKQDRAPPPEDDPPPDPDQPEDPEGEEPEEAVAARIETADLPAGRVGGLLEVLLAREKQKRALRKAARAERSADVERDW